MITSIYYLVFLLGNLLKANELQNYFIFLGIFVPGLSPFLFLCCINLLLRLWSETAEGFLLAFKIR